MSDSSNLKAGPVCEPCRQISFGSSGTQPHDAMRLQGALLPDAQDGHTARQFRCLTCNTLWLQHIDKWGSECGFRLTS